MKMGIAQKLDMYLDLVENVQNPYYVAWSNATTLQTSAA